LTEAFDEAARACRRLCGGPALSTYQGFMGALVKWSPVLIRALIATVRTRMGAIGSRFWRVDRWVPIAFDGSRSTAPRTRSNERAYCAANYGTGKTARYRRKKTKGMRRTKNEANAARPPEPQLWVTLLWHMGMRLPWAWRLGPSNASERDHVMTMLADEEFPTGTLFCGDAGFIGYPLWARIVGRGHDFLVRAGANVHLSVEGPRGPVLGPRRDQQVLSWPKEAQRAQQPPLRLRLIRTRIKKTKVWLLTSVLDPKALSPAQALNFYRLRWGIEVEFRGLKQTLGRASLRCRKDARVAVELEWSILGMAVAELWALKEQLGKRNARAKHPRRRSLAGTMRALRWCLRHVDDTCEPGRGLADRLRQAVTDDYKRASSKRARYRPLNPDKRSLGNPQLRALDADEMRKLKKMQPKLVI
jgi:hypothetical protein